jgi:hypothetical protein
MPSRIERLLDRQAAELAKLDEKDAALVLRALDDGRRDLAERLRRLPESSWTAQHTRMALAETEAGIRQLQERLGVVLADQERRRHELAMEHLLRVLREQESEFAEVGGPLRTRMIARLSQDQGLLLHRHSVQRYGSELITRIQREIVLGQTSQMTLDQVVDRIVSTDQGVFASMRYRAELIARMEAGRQYDDGHQASLEEASDLLDDPDDPDPLMKRADEYSDQRNHPFSRALHGRLAPVKGEWEVPVAEVQMWAEQLGKGMGGILWREEGGQFKGGRYPAHFNDRGRQVAWRRSWGA